MPQLIQYIDEISRDKKRDVLFLRFGKDIFFNYEQSAVRKKILTWFDQNAIPYQDCVGATSDKGFVVGYFGDVYIDVPFDTTNQQYIKLVGYLEDDKGVIKHKGVHFYYLPYAMAKEIVPRVYSESEDLSDLEN